MTHTFGFTVFPDLYGAGYLAASVVGAVLVVVLAFTLGLFLLKGYSFYTLARYRGIRSSWLSWIPVGQDWIRGSLSDQYKYLTAGRNQSRRYYLTMLSAASLALKVAATVVVIRSFAMAMAGFGYANFGHHPHNSEAALIQMLLTMGGLGLVTTCALIAHTVLHHMCMYDVYRSCEPKNAMAMMLLGLFFGALEPFFLFYVRKKDGGMPPRKDAPRQDPPRQTPPVDAVYETPSDGPEQL